MKGPLFNSTYKTFTRRDTLGLQNVSSSLQASICPVINVVTPHPFYWAFLTWNYYHYYSIESNKNHPDSEFNKNFVKRNDFFFVLSKYLAGNDMNGIVGRDNIRTLFPDQDGLGPFPYNERYYVSHFGGMQYYNFGCTYAAMHLIPRDIKRINLNDNSIGAKLTQSFDKVISNTSIYKNYISQNKLLDNISRSELLELSEYLSLNMEKMNDVKAIIYKALFSNSADGKKSTLSDSENYLNLLLSNGFITQDSQFSGDTARRILYGDKRPFILDKIVPSEQDRKTIVRWELVIANQYYVSAIEMIWKYLLSVLDVPATLDEWIDKAISTSIGLPTNESLSEIEKELSFTELSSNISNSVSNNTIHAALEVLMSIYCRFKNRLADFDMMPINPSAEEYSIVGLVKRIKNGAFKTVKDLLIYLINKQIVLRHETTAIRKRYQGRDGFLFEKSYGLYISRGSDYTIDIGLPGLRITNVFSVLKDLGKI